MPARMLLVGSGITGALTSTFIRRRLKDSVYLEVWDKAKGVGGRMSTSRSPSCNSCTVDLGAQYVTASPEELSKNKEIYELLLSNGLLVPLTATIEGIKLFPSGTRHFVAPKGMNSVVRFFLQCDEVKFEHHVTAISKQGHKLLVEAQGKTGELFDAVILTMPVPQILQVLDGIPLSNELNKSLECVKYSSRFALGMFYDTNDTAFNVPWEGKYIHNDDILRFVSLDNRKRSCKSEPDSCVFHTSVPFGYKNIHHSVDDVKETLLSHVRKVFPHWPEPINIKCQKWRYSQVVEPYANKPGYVVLMSSPLVVAGGDGFVESNFNGCLLSATKLAEIAVTMTKTE